MCVKPPANNVVHCVYLGFRNERVTGNLLLFSQELEKMLADTPPVWKGSSNLFRNLRERGRVPIWHNTDNYIKFRLNIGFRLNKQSDSYLEFDIFFHNNWFLIKLEVISNHSINILHYSSLTARNRMTPPIYCSLFSVYVNFQLHTSMNVGSGLLR